jgi:hypothetical protein
MLCTFVNCGKTVFQHWQWRKGVNKTPPFHHFPIANGSTKTIAHLSVEEGVVFPNWQCKKRRHPNTLKSSQRMGGLAKLAKISLRLSF